MDVAPSTGRKATFYWIKAFYNSWCGKINLAIENLNRASELSQTLNNTYVEAGSYWLQAYILYDVGKLELVNHYYLQLLNYIRKYSEADTTIFIARYKFELALVNIKQNLIDSAKIKLREIKSILPRLTEDKNLIEYEYDLLNAEILLAENSYTKAITAFQNKTQRNFPTIGFPEIAVYNLPYMNDGLARAYYKAGQIDNAISEYEKLITYNPKGKDRYLIHPRYHYRLAILYEQKGLKDKATLQYKKFLELWGEADKNLPEPIDAKNRLRKLLEEKNL
jgi:tetratricopeptide (TPR) repeat protein